MRDIKVGMKELLIKELTAIGNTKWVLAHDDDSEVVPVNCTTDSSTIYGLDPNKYEDEESKRIVTQQVEASILSIFVHIFTDTIKTGGIILDLSYEPHYDEKNEMYYLLTYTYCS